MQDSFVLIPEIKITSDDDEIFKRLASCALIMIVDDMLNSFKLIVG